MYENGEIQVPPKSALDYPVGGYDAAIDFWTRGPAETSVGPWDQVQGLLVDMGYSEERASTVSRAAWAAVSYQTMRKDK